MDMRQTFILLITIIVTSCGEKPSPTPNPQENLKPVKKSIAEIITQTPDGAPLILDKALNTTHEYFIGLQNCKQKSEKKKRDACFNRLRTSYKHLWGDAPQPENDFTWDLNRDQSLQPNAVIVCSVPCFEQKFDPHFEWNIWLNGSTDSFSLTANSIFHKALHEHLLSQYKDHITPKVSTTPPQRRTSYKAEILQTLENDFSKYKFSEERPKTHLHDRWPDRHEFVVLSGEGFSGYGEWETNYINPKCRKKKSSFYKIKIRYQSEWLENYLGGRDIAYFNVCRGKSNSHIPHTLYRLGYSN